MPFCSNCGHKFVDGAKFCPSCGAAAAEETSTQEQHSTQQPRSDQRQQVFEGELRKCPNCGAALNAFEITCPVCGVELRGTKASTVIQEFTDQLGHLKKGQQSDFIINFPIPNTKEDILEFMILAASNIKPISGRDDNLNLAWSSKFEQAYQKARIAARDASDLARIEGLYRAKKEEAEKAKAALKKRRTGLIAGFICSCVLLILLACFKSGYNDLSDMPTPIHEIYFFIAFAAVFGLCGFPFGIVSAFRKRTYL